MGKDSKEREDTDGQGWSNRLMLPVEMGFHHCMLLLVGVASSGPLFIVEEDCEERKKNNKPLLSMQPLCPISVTVSI